MRFGSEGSGTFTSKPILSLSSFMLSVVVGLISSFTMSTVYDMALASLGEGRQARSGVWHGQWQGVHAVTIKLEESGDALSGTARFARVIATRDGLKAIGETAELPLMNPKLDGDRLSFEVRGADESNPVILAEMEMRFTDEGEVELRRTGGEPEGTREDRLVTISMKREQSF